MASVFNVVVDSIADAHDFTIIGGVDGEEGTDVDGFRIGGVSPELATATNGHLRNGDRLLAVNGLSLEGLTHEQATSVLKTAGYPLFLEVERQPQTDVEKMETEGTKSNGMAWRSPAWMERAPASINRRMKTNDVAGSDAGDSTSQTPVNLRQEPTGLETPSSEAKFASIAESDELRYRREIVLTAIGICSLSLLAYFIYKRMS